MKRVAHIDRYTALAFAIVALALTVGCQQQPAGMMTQEEANALVQQVLPIWNDGNLDLIDQNYSPDYVRHEPGVGDIVGLVAFKDYVTQVRTGFPDFHVTADEVLVAGDKLVVRWTDHGTNTGPFNDQPPTGKVVQTSGVGLSTIVDGKTTEEWIYFDTLAMYEQLGYTLTPPAMEATE